MPITDDVRKVGGTVLEQGKVALDEARKPWYAAVGAGELAYGQLQTQLTQLPTEVQARLRKLQSVPGQLDPAALRDAVETATVQGRRTYGAYAQQAKETYETLAHRGELVVRRLRRSPEVKDTFAAAQELVADAGDAVAKAGDTVAKAGDTVARTSETVAKAEDAVTEPGRPTTTAPRRKPAAAGRTATKTLPAQKATSKKS